MRRRALITGAGKRVGRAIALHLAARDVDVCVHYRSSAKEAEEVAAACRERGVEAFTLQADLAHADQTRALAAALAERWDTLTVLVNNASLFVPRPFDETSLDELRTMHGVHVEAPFLLSRDLLPQLRAASVADPELESSLVVHMVDIAIERPFYGYTAYAVSKAGLAMLIKSMAVELAPAVRTIGLAPGHVVWPPDYDDTTKARMLRRIPMKRVGEVEDVARAVAFALFDGPYVNGDVLKLDGGLSQRY